MNQRNGDPPTDNDDLLKEWATYFEKLLNIRNEERQTEIPSAATNLGICTGNFTLNELRKATNKMKLNKSPRTDFAVTVETLKFGGNELQNVVLNICNSVLNSYLLK